jgi:hypothetical protein
MGRFGERRFKREGRRPANSCHGHPDRKAPSVACSIQARLGVCNAVCFDINAVCSGFLYGMSIAEAYISMGVYDTALVIGVDVFSRITDWNKRDSVFFGDGAGAALFGFGGESIIKLYSDGRGSEGFTAVDMFKMDKRAVYNAAVTYLPRAISEVLDEAGLTIDDIDVMIPHQPSIRVLKETAKRIGLPWKKVKTNMDRYANTAAATIPILLDEVRPPKGEQGFICRYGFWMDLWGSNTRDMKIIIGASGGIGSKLFEHYNKDLTDGLVGTFFHNEEESEYMWRVDITNYLDVETFAESIDLHDGQITLINCAGITIDGVAHKMNPQDFWDVIEVNLVGTFNVIRAFLPSCATGVTAG